MLDNINYVIHLISKKYKPITFITERMGQDYITEDVYIHEKIIDQFEEKISNIDIVAKLLGYSIEKSFYNIYKGKGYIKASLQLTWNIMDSNGHVIFEISFTFNPKLKTLKQIMFCNPKRTSLCYSKKLNNFNKIEYLEPLNAAMRNLK